MTEMTDIYIEWRKAQNIKKITLPNKEKFYQDLTNIENSWSGRLDTWQLANTFVLEAEQQLVNAIELFEMGYFDCAYFSLRSAIDVSTTLILLSDSPEKEKSEYIKAWKSSGKFPMRAEIIKFLSEHGSVFADMKEKMTDFFEDCNTLSKELNRYVHKQGFKNFYVSRNHPINGDKAQDNFIKNFEKHLKVCIGIVAVMRLAIDPFPVLLMDEEILFRCFDSMTEPYSESFVSEYIEDKTLNSYLSTELYKSTYNSFINKEKKTQAVFDVVKFGYIDTKKIDEMFLQSNLMSKNDIICVLMVYACEKVVKIHSFGGIESHFTDRTANRNQTSWGGPEFTKFEKAKDKINQRYAEAYISTFIFEEETYFAEHNELLDSEDIARICGIVIGAIFKMDEDIKGEVNEEV